jgi:galactofuranose transport system permease protein
MTTISTPPAARTRTDIPTFIKARLPQLRNILQQQGALIALIIAVVFSLAHYNNFDSVTITSVLSFNAQFGLIALGMTFVIMTGGIDLSVGGIAALSSVVAALSSSHGFYYALIAAILAGMLVGLINGFVVAWFQLPPFITTLATLYITHGTAERLINDADHILLDQHSDFNTIGNTSFSFGGLFSPPLPFSIVLLVVAFVIGTFVLRYTRFGRNVLAIGGNMEAARLMGLPIKRTLLMVYTLSGALSGMAGVLLAISLNGGSAIEGKGWELIAIAAVVVGGTLLTGGVGSVFGTFVGVLLLGMIVEILQLENNYQFDHGSSFQFNPFWQDIIRGIFLFVVVLLQSQLQRRRGRQQT